MVAKGKRKPSVRRRILTLVAILLVLATGLVLFGFSNLNPLVIRMAEARARQLAVEAINQAVYEVMGASVRYNDLVEVVTDEQGRISMLFANTMLMNNLASQAALAAQRNLGALAEQGLSLPRGSALGRELFSGAGPRIRVSVIPVGSVTTNFITAFQSAGINQTRHEISLMATVTMHIVIPGGADTIEVKAYVPVAESIIVGDVPDTFVNVPSMDEALNLLP